MPTLNRRALPPPTADRRQGVRGALLHTLPGRAIVIGVGIKIIVSIVGAVLGRVPPFLAVVDTVAGVAAVIGLSIFAVRLMVLAKRRLLWRVRRKLILSYIFIGFVPALLLVAFALLCAFLLFYDVSSYLVTSRLRALSEQARFLAAVLPVDGTDRVDDMARGEPAARRDHRFAGGQPLRILRVANVPALREDVRAARAMDRAVHAAAAEQARVGRVHDRVGVLARDVADLYDDPRIHRRIMSPSEHLLP